MPDYGKQAYEAYADKCVVEQQAWDTLDWDKKQGWDAAASAVIAAHEADRQKAVEEAISLGEGVYSGSGVDTYRLARVIWYAKESYHEQGGGPSGNWEAMSPEQRSAYAAGAFAVHKALGTDRLMDLIREYELADSKPYDPWRYIRQALDELQSVRFDLNAQKSLTETWGKGLDYLRNTLIEMDVPELRTPDDGSNWSAPIAVRVLQRMHQERQDQGRQEHNERVQLHQYLTRVYGTETKDRSVWEWARDVIHSQLQVIANVNTEVRQLLNHAAMQGAPAPSLNEDLDKTATFILAHVRVKLDDLIRLQENYRRESLTISRYQHTLERLVDIPSVVHLDRGPGEDRYSWAERCLTESLKQLWELTCNAPQDGSDPEDASLEESDQHEAVMEQRRAEYGPRYRNHVTVGMQWAALIYQRYGVRLQMEADLVALMMVELKTNRAAYYGGRGKPDTYLDGRNYLTIAEFCADVALGREEEPAETHLENPAEVVDGMSRAMGGWFPVEKLKLEGVETGRMSASEPNVSQPPRYDTPLCTSVYEDRRCAKKAGHDGPHSCGSFRWLDDATVYQPETGKATPSPSVVGCDSYYHDGHKGYVCERPLGHDGPHKWGLTFWTSVAASVDRPDREFCVRCNRSLADHCGPMRNCPDKSGHRWTPSYQ